MPSNRLKIEKEYKVDLRLETKLQPQDTRPSGPLVGSTRTSYASRGLHNIAQVHEHIKSNVQLSN